MMVWRDICIGRCGGEIACARGTTIMCPQIVERNPEQAFPPSWCPYRLELVVIVEIDSENRPKMATANLDIGGMTVSGKWE